MENTLIQLYQSHITLLQSAIARLEALPRLTMLQTQRYTGLNSKLIKTQLRLTQLKG